MITPEQFKDLWMSQGIDRWGEFNIDELNKAPITTATKQFLQIGFPESTAPYLNFGWRSNDWKFNNVEEVYARGDSSKSQYWLFGSDGSGNPICFDTSKNDRIILLDHEQDFESIENINTNISELAQCLLAYRHFVEIVQIGNREDAFLESNFSKSQVLELEEGLKSINPNIIKESDFWRSELQQLYNEYK